MKRLMFFIFLVAVLVVVVQPPGAHVYGKNVATHQLTTWCLQNSQTLVANNTIAGDENSNFNVFTSKLNIGTITVPLVSININANCTNLFIDRGSTVASQNFNLVVRKENRSVMQTLNTRVYYNLKKPKFTSDNFIMVNNNSTADIAKMVRYNLIKPINTNNFSSNNDNDGLNFLKLASGGAINLLCDEYNVNNILSIGQNTTAGPENTTAMQNQQENITSSTQGLALSFSNLS